MVKSVKKFNLCNKIRIMPKGVGVYLFKDKTGRILYVGKAVNLKNRVRSHFELRAPASKNFLSPRSSTTGARSEIPHRKPRLSIADARLSGTGWRDKIADIDWIETDDEKQALILENELIKKYKPRYNVQWKDDKSYAIVAFSNDRWPRVIITRPKQIASKKKPLINNEHPIIGPFVNSRELKQVLRSLRKIIPYRTCKNPYNKPCLQWHLGLCPAHGNSSEVGPRKNYLRGLNALSQFLRLYAGEQIRIEAYDISNIHGDWATGSMIVFYGSKPDKKYYRRFKIKTVIGANDTAMIQEVLKRRFNHPEWPTPDLILIDGGRAQLSAALQVANSFWRMANSKISKPHAISHMPFAIVALAKQQEKIYTKYSNKTLKLSSLPSELNLIFQSIRNEAHRFAIFYYRHLHGQVVKIRQRKQKSI